MNQAQSTTYVFEVHFDIQHFILSMTMVLENEPSYCVLQMNLGNFKQLFLVHMVRMGFAFLLFSWSTYLLKKKVTGRIL